MARWLGCNTLIANNFPCFIKQLNSSSCWKASITILIFSSTTAIVFLLLFLCFGVFFLLLLLLPFSLLLLLPFFLLWLPLSPFPPELEAHFLTLSLVDFDEDSAMNRFSSDSTGLFQKSPLQQMTTLIKQCTHFPLYLWKSYLLNLPSLVDADMDAMSYLVDKSMTSMFYFSNFASVAL